MTMHTPSDSILGFAQKSNFQEVMPLIPFRTVRAIRSDTHGKNATQHEKRLS